MVSHLKAEPLLPGALDQLEQQSGAAARQDVEANPFLAYGSTILGVLVAPEFLVHLQLGDGDILLVSDAEEVSRPWPRDGRLLGSETTSLCAPEAWKEVHVAVQLNAGQAPRLILLSTDGYADSFRDDRGFLKVASDILKIICREGVEKVEQSMESWLREASQLGSGDDTTLGILYHR